MKPESKTEPSIQKTRIGLFLLLGLLSGCVLPGGDRPVGAVNIHGSVIDALKRDHQGEEIAVVRKEFAKQQQFDALFQVGDPACNPVKRYSSSIGSDGRFSLSLPSFLSGDPIWIIPPFGTLLPFAERADNQGLIFLLKTPEPGGQVYEIDVRKDKSSVRILKGDNWRFQKLSPSEQTRIHVTVKTLSTNLTSKFSMKIREVGINLSE